MTPARKPSGHSPLFETHLGVRLFWCNRAFLSCGRKFFARSFGPAVLSKGRIAFSFYDKGNFSVIHNGRRAMCRPGHLSVVCGGDSAGWRTEPPGPHIYSSLGLALEQGEVANILLHRKFAGYYILADPGEFIARFDQLLQALAEPVAVREWMVAGAILKLIGLILKETAPPLRQGGTALSMAEKARFAQNWANANLASEIDLAQWSRAVGLHPKSFERMFKRETGSPPKRWLEIQRLEMARQYLLSTGNSVKQIARAVGYEDAFYFSRTFRRRFGQSPLQYRKSGKGF
jgi:AraC-like DNA-binding protein